MNEQQRNELRAKAGDFKMYSLVLFSLGAFFYFGTMIPGALEAAKKTVRLAGGWRLFHGGFVLFTALRRLRPPLGGRGRPV
ncbi:hypothetical protein LR69_00325 [Geobacillus sp. BCO2]|nr:hypothetical protein LR69_00325 [Geobacillus sp. BCO2]